VNKESNYTEVFGIAREYFENHSIWRGFGQ